MMEKPMAKVAAPQDVTVRLIPLTELRPATWNPRLIKDKAFRKLCDSILADPAFLWRRPILAQDNGDIYAGNMRYRSVENLIATGRWPDELAGIPRGQVPAIVEDVPIDVAKARALRDNNQAGEWVDEQLGEILYELAQSGTDVETLGFDDALLRQLMEAAGGGAPGSQPDPGPELDRAEELREQWQTEAGQLWVIDSATVPGKQHRILIADSTQATNMSRLMGEDRAALLFTSPPYWLGMSYEEEHTEPEIRAFITRAASAWVLGVRPEQARIIIDTGTTAIHRIDHARKLEVIALLPLWAEALRPHGWLQRHIRIWAKGGTYGGGRGAAADFVDQHWEEIGTYEPAPSVPEIEPEAWDQLGAFWNPAGKQRGQLRIGEPWAQQGYWDDVKSERFGPEHAHIAAFPVEIPARHIKLYAEAGELILEPFLGSGTTMVAAEQLGRLCNGIERSAAYAAVSLERMLKMGLEPRLSAS